MECFRYGAQDVVAVLLEQPSDIPGKLIIKHGYYGSESVFITSDLIVQAAHQVRFSYQHKLLNP
jgi:hypothetical protein